MVVEEAKLCPNTAIVVTGRAEPKSNIILCVVEAFVFHKVDNLWSVTFTAG